MTERSVLAITALLAVGCSTTVVTPFQIASRREFPPEQRPTVWGRAVTAFQMTGRIIHMSDAAGGVLQSAPQGSVVQCTEYRSVANKAQTSGCYAEEFSQFTVSNDGVAFLRLDKKVRGEVYQEGLQARELMTAKDMERQQLEADQLLDFIVGKTKDAPKPPDPPLSPVRVPMNI